MSEEDTWWQIKPTFHFGEKLRSSPYGFRVSRELYVSPSHKNHKPMPRDAIAHLWATNPEAAAISAAKYEDDEWKILTPEAWRQAARNALTNFDINMAYFTSLDESEFQVHLSEVVQSVRGMQEVLHLPDYEGVSGVYVMVIGEYKQAYIGQSTNIRTRVKSHWGASLPVSKAVFGRVESSVMSIDGFRALDTTQLFVVKAADSRRDQVERAVEGAFDPRYTLNRMSAGRIGYQEEIGAPILLRIGREMQGDSREN